MKRPGFITTSWDDGHILDFRIADLLTKFNLRHLLYSSRSVNRRHAQSNIRQLAQHFEIGAHTMRHVFLDTASTDVANSEIRDSKNWVEQLTGRPCPMFCPPAGKFDASHIQLIRSASFSALRSVN